MKKSVLICAAILKLTFAEMSTPGSNSALNPNLKRFPVTPVTTYTFSAPIAATASAADAGYATIIFLDAQGKGLKRDFYGSTHRDLISAS